MPLDINPAHDGTDSSNSTLRLWSKLGFQRDPRQHAQQIGLNAVGLPGERVVMSQTGLNQGLCEPSQHSCLSPVFQTQAHKLACRLDRR